MISAKSKFPLRLFVFALAFSVFATVLNEGLDWQMHLRRGAEFFGGAGDDRGDLDVPVRARE